jgi:hypothetical protein
MPAEVNHPTRPRYPWRRALLALSALGLLALGGCTGFGPQTMRYQQADYANAVADGAKRQTLLNIVKLRYGDVPTFISVSQILAGYSLQGTFSVGTDVLSGGSLRLSDSANLGVGGTFTNNPTVTYAPVIGADLARTFLAPLQPADLFGLMLAGVPPELVFGLGLHSIGSHYNERSSPGAYVAAEPEFAEVLGLLVDLQRSGQLAVRLAVQDQQRIAWLSLAGNRDAGDRATERRLRELLGLPADRQEFEVVYTLAPPRSGQIAIRTRALIEVLGQLAADIDVPSGDVVEGRTYDTAATDGWADRFPRISVRHGFLEPPDAFVSVPYDGDWFWIANNDLRTKRVFTFVMLLLSLSESSKPGQPPVIAIPTG